MKEGEHHESSVLSFWKNIFSLLKALDEYSLQSSKKPYETHSSHTH